MKKKEYERPTMQVVQLKGQQQLLAGSVTGLDTFGDGGDPLVGEPSSIGELPLFDPNQPILFE